jgi:hypothetical protein
MIKDDPGLWTAAVKAAAPIVVVYIADRKKAKSVFCKSRKK